MTEDERPFGERGDLAEAAVDCAIRLAVAMRDEGPAAIADVLRTAPEGRMDVVAMAACAMIDLDQPVATLLAWTDHFLDPQGALTLFDREAALDAGYLTYVDDLGDLDPEFAASLEGLDEEERQKRVKAHMRKHERRIRHPRYIAYLERKAQTKREATAARREGGDGVHTPACPHPVDTDAKPVYAFGDAGERPAQTREEAS